jgi:hypothetical protein
MIECFKLKAADHLELYDDVKKDTTGFIPHLHTLTGPKVYFTLHYTRQL